MDILLPAHPCDGGVCEGEGREAIAGVCEGEGREAVAGVCEGEGNRSCGAWGRGQLGPERGALSWQRAA